MRTSEWTLDYPPFFAYFEWLLSQAAQYADPDMLKVQNLDFGSWQTIYFQRTTVIAADLVLAYALHKYIQTSPQALQKASHAVAISVLLSPALLIIDHIHFQYNGFLYGILILSMVSLRKQSTMLIGGGLFAVLLCLKHIYLYLAPAYFVYLLRVYCLSQKSLLRIRFGNSIELALELTLVFGSAFGPFWYWGQIEQTVSSTHCIHASSGLPGQLPLVKLFLVPNWETFVGAVTLCGYASFLFGWHVHEKAILLVIIPFSLLALKDRRYLGAFRPLAVAGHVSLFPLIFHAQEFPVKTVYTVFWLVLFLLVFDRLAPVPSKPRVFLLDRFSLLYIIVSIPLILYCSLVHELVFGQQYEFLPLMFTSSYSAIGIVGSWIGFSVYAFWSTRQAKSKTDSERDLAVVNTENTQQVSKVWAIEETDEVFTSYHDYLRREALRSELEASGEVEDAFPESLREPILLDWIYEEFKQEFYPGENVIFSLDDERLTGQIKEKVKFPELARTDGSIERKSFARYFCHIDQRPGQEALLDEDHISRERKLFTKQRLRSFLKNTVTRESWAGAPWLVKPKLADEYRIKTEIPQELTQQYQAKLRKTHNLNGKKGDLEGPILNFRAYGPQGGPQYQLLRPKGGRKPTAQEEQLQLQHSQFLQYHQPTANIEMHLPSTFYDISRGQGMVNGIHALAAKGFPRPAAPPPSKYPIEDLEIPPVRDGTHRPPLKYLSEDTPAKGQVSDGKGTGITMESVGLLLETWNTLNVYCEVFELDSFTFDDYVEALRFSSEDVHCELVVEIHCAVLKKLVNDLNDKNGQVQITLPHQPESEEDDLVTVESHQATPTPEPDTIRPPARSTRSSLIKTETAELKDSTNGLPLGDNKTHRAAEMDHSTRGYDWKMRLRKRDFQDGHWVIIVVGLLNQLAGNARLSKTCNDILTHLAPLDREPNADTAFAQYHSLDINHRIKLLQILCMKSLETKAIKQYMEDCGLQMTEHRKAKNEVKRNWRAAVEELRQLHEERKALQPENTSASPLSDIREIEESNLEPEDEEMPDEAPASDFVAESEDELPSQGRSLRRASDRTMARKKTMEAEKERKAAAAAEKVKKPSKEEKKYEKVLAKIEAAKARVKEYEDEIATVENDLREADCPRTRVLGKDRFWNRYYWMERNAMPYAGLPDSSTAHAGYANGCIWVQGPDDLERVGFIELCDAENAQYERAFQLTVPQRKVQEEGKTHVFTALQWGYYDEPDSLDVLIGWLDVRGVRESKLRKELCSQRERISIHMKKRLEYLAKGEEKAEISEPPTRVSTRTKAPMANEETNHRESIASDSDLSFADAASASKRLPKKEKPNGAVKLKKSIAKKTKPKDIESNGEPTTMLRVCYGIDPGGFDHLIIGTNTARATRSPSPSSPAMNGTGAKTGEERPVCKHCKKPVDQIHYDSHVSICLENKKEAAKRKKERKQAKEREAAAKAKEQQGDKDKDGDSVMAGAAAQIRSQDDVASLNGDAASATGQSTKNPPKKSAAHANLDGPKKTKKRKADAQEPAEKEPKKKKLKKDEPPKPKLPKAKGPVNVEIQCGVPLDKEKGGFCARSLTCKSHSMGLKRAVPGRSLPYDTLLAMYQKKNQAKQQKALMEAQVGAMGDADEAENGLVDSEEERETVMKGLARWRPRPAEQMVTVPIGLRYRYVRLKEMLGNALGGGVRNLFSVPSTVGVAGGQEGVMEPLPPGGGEESGRRLSNIGQSQGHGHGHGHPVPKGVGVPMRKGSVTGVA
ncbi:MAG: hypothetical protein Q9163_000156 [Psora crenata]